MIQYKYVFSSSFLHAFDLKKNEYYNKNLSFESFDRFKKFIDHSSGEIIIDKKHDSEFGKDVLSSIIMNSDRYQRFCKKSSSKKYHIKFLINSNEFKELKSLNYLSIDDVVEKWVYYSKSMMDDFYPDKRINWACILKRFDLKIEKVIIEDKYIYTGDGLINAIVPIIKYFQSINKGKFIVIGIIDGKYPDIDEHKIFLLKKLEKEITTQNIELIIMPSQGNSQHDRRIYTSFHTINIPSGIKNLPEGKKSNLYTEPSVRSLLGDKDSREQYIRLFKDLERRLIKMREKGFSTESKNKGQVNA